MGKKKKSSPSSRKSGQKTTNELDVAKEQITRNLNKSQAVTGDDGWVDINPNINENAGKVFDEMPQSRIARQKLVPASLSSDLITLGVEGTSSEQRQSPKASVQNANAMGKPRSSLFKNNRAPNEGFKLEFYENSGKGCGIEAEDITPIADAWGPTLVGYVAGRFPGKKAIMRCCQSWAFPCNFSIHESGWLIFKFKQEQDLNHVLENGPYFIFRRPLLLKVMPPFFRFEPQLMAKKKKSSPSSRKSGQKTTNELEVPTEQIIRNFNKSQAVTGDDGWVDINRNITENAGKVFDEMPQSRTARQKLVPASSSSVFITLGVEDTSSEQRQSPKASAQNANAMGKPRSSIFKNNRAPNGGWKLEYYENSGEVVQLEDEDLTPVDDILIGYVAGRFPGKKAIMQCCQSWAFPCHFYIHKSGWLIFRFKQVQDLNHVLENGPYFIFKRPLLLKVIPPFFQFEPPTPESYPTLFPV